MTVGFGQRVGRGEVDRYPDQRDDQDRGASDLGRVNQAGDAFVDDQQREHQQRRAVELGRQDLGPFEAEGERALGRSGCEADDDQREADRAGVGEHVRGVGEERQRVREDPDGHLKDHEAEDQPKRDGELAAIGIG